MISPAFSTAVPNHSNVPPPKQSDRANSPVCSPATTSRYCDPPDVSNTENQASAPTNHSSPATSHPANISHHYKKPSKEKRDSCSGADRPHPTASSPYPSPLGSIYPVSLYPIHVLDPTPDPPSFEFYNPASPKTTENSAIVASLISPELLFPDYPAPNAHTGIDSPAPPSSAPAPAQAEATPPSSPPAAPTHHLSPHLH